MRRAGVSRLARRDRGPCLWTPRFFEKNRVKLLYCWGFIIDLVRCRRICAVRFSIHASHCCGERAFGPSAPPGDGTWGGMGLSRCGGSEKVRQRPQFMLRIVAEVIGRCTIQSAGTSPVLVVGDGFASVRREIGKRTGKLFKLVRPLYVSINGELHVEKEYIGDTIPAKCFHCHPIHSLCMDSVMPYKTSENFF